MASVGNWPGAGIRFVRLTVCTRPISSPKSWLKLPSSFDIVGHMETLSATDAALAHESRLGFFRLLIEPGPKGKHANAIGEQLEMALGTLSFRLAQLSRVGLIQGGRESRFIHYSANFATMDGVDYVPDSQLLPTGTKPSQGGDLRHCR